MAMVLDTHEEIPVIVTNIELTNTGLRLQYTHEEGTLSLSNQEIRVITAVLEVRPRATLL